MTLPVVTLSDIDLAEVGQVVASRPAGSLGALHRGDFARYAYVLGRCVGTSLLDVGCGRGVFLDAAESSGRFSRVVGVDQQAGDPQEWTRYVLDATSLPFDAASFDTVSAQEILEHQPDGDLERMLSELRRVTARRLLITVPFCQRKLKGGHVQRFCADRLQALFPTATITILDKQNGVYPWALIEEDVA